MYNIHFDDLAESSKYICETSSIYFSCVLKNEADGVIWGNRPDSPLFLLVFSQYQEGFQLMGQPLPKEEWKDFRIWFDKTMIPFLEEKGLVCFEYGSDTQELADMFQIIFDDIAISSDNQKIFHWSETELRLQQPEECQVKKVDRHLLEEKYTNMEYITDELINAYGDMEQFFDNGIAYVAIKDHALIARADMLFSDSGYGNISVNTKEAYRRTGISSYLVLRTIEDTCKQGLTPIWDCTDDNFASEKTAIKCGFHLIRKDIISWFMLNDFKKTEV
ncbi:MAG TPA: GNAT family N-acetyltransferase [Lachnospiraceae bacterium]|nr:GNAT family N-acetyltransferase [Lachnospiraceae bacterium]